MRTTFPGSIRSVGEREFKFTAVTAKLGRDGHILEPAGVDLSEYRKVPVILWQHSPSSPVARCTQIGLVEGEVRGTAEFAPAGTSAVDEAFGCVKSGVISAVSMVSTSSTPRRSIREKARAPAACASRAPPCWKFPWLVFPPTPAP